MKETYLPACAATVALCGLPAAAQPVPVEAPDAPPPVVYKIEDADPLNKVSLSYRMGLNIKVDFRKLGGFARMGNPGPATGSNSDRTYDQGGYNRVDASGNEGGLTWYWGYGNPDAVQGDSLVLQSSTSPADQEVEGQEESVQHGFELSYIRQLVKGKYGKLGAEAAFGYMPLSISDKSFLQGQVNRIVDSFELGGVIPPAAPYNGTFEGPGPLIDSSPSRSRAILQDSANILGKRTLESDVFIFRLGPNYEFPIKGRLSGSLGAGLTVAYADSELRYRETVIIPGVGRQSREASSSDSDLLVGGYAGGALAYNVLENTDIFAGAYFQSAGRSVTKSGGTSLSRKEGVLDMGESVVVNVGISYSF